MPTTMPIHEEEVFQAAASLPIGERAAYLDAVCAADPRLRERVERLLGSHDASVFMHGTGVSISPAIEEQLARLKPEESGESVGPYKLLQQIGEGGFGTVWMAEQLQPVRRRVALKIIKLGMDTKEVIARFEQERQALAMMDHPNIARVFDAGATQFGRPYFVMELVRGVKITDYCDEQGLSTRERIDLFILVCHAVQHAHQKGIIHRDIKPSNVLVTINDGEAVPKVIDFGVAKATQGRLTEATFFTQFQQMVGTPIYMSPEQAEMTSLDIDTRSDIYALGVLLYELLTGRTPIDSATMASAGLDEIRRIIRDVDPPRPSTCLRTLDGNELTTVAKRRHSDPAKLPASLSGDIDWIVMKCLEKDRKRRYDTANGLAADLRRHLENEPVVARPSSQLYRFQKMVRRNKAPTVAVVGIVAALTVGLGLAMTALARERIAKERELAQSVRADTVAAFINSLVSDAVPMMIRQGNVRGARELVDTAERLAASSLANAPAAEINLRLRLRSVFNNRLYDVPSGLRQAEAIVRLLPRVSDDQLSISREELLLYPAVAHLFGAEAGEEEEAIQELQNFEADFLKRTPPARKPAMMCRYYQGLRHMIARRWDRAEEAFAAAYELRPANVEGGNWTYKLPAYFANSLSASGKLARAEEVVRENLKLPDRAKPETREGYLLLIDALSDTLCRQGRFADASRMLDEQKRVVASRGASEADMIQVETLGGAVLARSGDARGALPIFASLATHRLADVFTWHSAVWLAIAAGDADAHERLCRVALLQFASTAEGQVAAYIADGLLTQSANETMVSLARGMVDRVADAQDFSKELAPFFSAMLALREHRPADALAIMERSLSSPQIAALGPTSEKRLAIRTRCAFLHAMICAELGRVDEARRKFAEGNEALTAMLADQPGNDRTSEWPGTYASEAMRQEAQRLIESKGIPVASTAAK